MDTLECKNKVLRGFLTRTSIGKKYQVQYLSFSYLFKINEAHLHAKMDYECRIRGAEILAYPPVVAGKIK